jgi:ABC-2 type transport system permease protein
MLRPNKYMTAASVSLKSAYAYKAGSLFGLLLYTLFIFVLFSVWKAVYSGGEIEGFSLGQMIWYVCFTEFIVFGCRTGVFNQLNEEVKNGDIAYQLNKPYNYVFYKFANAFGETAINSIVYLAAALILGLLFAGPLTTFKLWMLPPVALSILLGMILNFFTMTALGLTAFFIEENTAFYLLWQKLVFMLGMFLPLEFLPGWLQGIARWLPFPYIAWAPARLLVNFSWQHFLTAVPVQAAYCLVFMGVSWLIYRKGVKGINAHGG